MRKAFLITVIILTVIMAGCATQGNDDLKSENVFQPLSTQKTGNDYHIEGTAYLCRDRNLVDVEAAADTEISISGSLERNEGEIKLLFQDTNGDIAAIIDSEDYEEAVIEVNLTLQLNKGNGRFYFSGSSCIFDFDLTFSPQEEVNYFFSNMQPDPSPRIKGDAYDD